MVRLARPGWECLSSSVKLLLMRYLLPLVCFVSLYACNEPSPSSPTESEAVATTESDTAKLAPVDTDSALVATALLAAPAASRSGCKVIGYNMAGEFVTFREGSNDFTCVTDNPNQEGFNAACYHNSLEPFMTRGRVLREEGRNAQEIFATREEEAKSGALSMPPAGATLHVYFGKEARYDPTTGEVPSAQYRYVVYLPFATAASTGLPETPVAPNHPWIMDPGTHRAHIMISPVAE